MQAIWENLVSCGFHKETHDDMELGMLTKNHIKFFQHLVNKNTHFYMDDVPKISKGNT